jgi:hypothetical protein
MQKALEERGHDEPSAFQAAARQRGFVEVNECAEGTVLWLRRNGPETARDTHERMCIDSLISIL